MPPSSDSTTNSYSANDCKHGPHSMKGFLTTIVEHSITYIIYYLTDFVSWEKKTIHHYVHNRIVPFHVFLPLHYLLMIWLNVIFFYDLRSFVPFHYKQFYYTTHWIVHNTHSFKTISLNNYGGLKGCGWHYKCRNPTLKECEDDTHTPKMGTWESSGTFKTLKFDYRGQNTFLAQETQD